MPLTHGSSSVGGSAVPGVFVRPVQPVRRLGAVALLALTACITGCSGNGTEGDPEVSETIEQVMAARAPELMRIAGVEGVGQGLCDDVACIRVFVRDASVISKLPKALGGYTIDPVITGMIRPLTTGG